MGRATGCSDHRGTRLACWSTAADGSIFTWQSGAPFSIVSQYATFNRGRFRSSTNTAWYLTHQQLSGDVEHLSRPTATYTHQSQAGQPGWHGRAVFTAIELRARGSGRILQSATGTSGTLQSNAFMRGVFRLGHLGSEEFGTPRRSN